MGRRRRNSTQKCKKGADNSKSNNVKIQSSGRSIADLPMPVLVDILLKLPVKTILLCRCVSKTWHSLLSSPQFAKLHFSGQGPSMLLRTLDSDLVSRMLYLVEPETCHNFDLGYCSCDGSDHSDECVKTCHNNFDLGYCICKGFLYSDQCVKTCHMKLDTKLKIPLRNAEMLLNAEVGYAQMDWSAERKHWKRFKSKDHIFKIVNSCNGFVCLCEPSSNEPVVVCNPITGEYTNLPVAGEKTQHYVDCGFGFSPKTNQYKVIRMAGRWILEWDVTGHFRWRVRSRRTEIHTLGTGSWKSVGGGGPISTHALAFPTYLKGCIHWFCIHTRQIGTSDYIVSFNFDNEQFQSVPPPPCKNHFLRGMPNRSMGVLEGCLCICEASDYINIWVMKKYGVQESWTKMFSIDTKTDHRWPVGLYQPIKYLEDGAVLMFHYFSSSLICYNPNGPKFKYLKIFGAISKFEAIAHIPSFISLKEAVVGDNAVVLNISSRCAEFKLLGETADLSLVEKDGNTASDSDDSFSYRYRWTKYLFFFDY